MPKRPRFGRSRAKVQCNSCGHQFEDLVWHRAILPKNKPEPLSWVVESWEGPTCPSCGSRLIGPQR
jgi:DNA-directed RNA polymerase subunit RPC12/RpoP